MEINEKDIINLLEKNKKVYFPVQNLSGILSKAELHFEHNTLISDYIRIIKLDNNIIVQEKTDKNEIALHLFEDEKTAEKFVNDRLEIYEKMWDGCGCKVKYYD